MESQKKRNKQEAAQAAIADLQATIQQASENMANRTVFENGSNSLAFHNVAYDYATTINDLRNHYVSNPDEEYDLDGQILLANNFYKEMIEAYDSAKDELGDYSENLANVPVSFNGFSEFEIME